MKKRDPKFEIVRALVSISKTTRGLVTVRLEHLNLRSGQDALLVALASGGSQPVSSVAAAINVRPSTVSKMVDRLSQKGLIERSPDVDDARHVCLALTPQGFAIVEEIRAVHAALGTDLRTALGDDLPELSLAMTTMDKTLKARLSRLR